MFSDAGVVKETRLDDTYYADVSLHRRDIHEIPDVGYESETRFAFEFYADDIPAQREEPMSEEDDED